MKQRLYNLLRWSEQYTRTDMLYLSKGGFWLSVGQSIEAISGLILAVAFANLLPQHTYGVYQFVISTAAVFAAFTLTGMQTAITKAVAHGNDGVLRYGFHVKLLWNTGIALTAGCTALYYFLNDNTQLAAMFLIVGAFAPFLEGFKVYQPYLLGKHAFRESALLGFWRKLLPLSAILTTLYLSDDPIIIICAYFVSHTISMGWMYVLTVRRFAVPYSEDPDAFRYSTHLSVMNLFSAIANNIDKVLIFHFLGAVPTAVYTFARLPIQQLRAFINTLKGMLLPKMSTRSLHELQATLWRKALLFFFALALLVVAYVFAAPHLFALLFPSYMDAIVISQVLALGLLTAPALFFSQALTAHERTRELYILRLSIPILKIGLFATLLPLFGLWGAVIALLVSQLASMLLTSSLFLLAR